MENTLDSIVIQESSDRKYIYASQGKRFANYLLDAIGYYVFSSVIEFLIEGLLALIGYDDFLAEENMSISTVFIILILEIIFAVSYYTILEYAFKGKTLGKLITKTRAVTVEGYRMDFNTTLIRSLCRMVPFEPISFLIDPLNGWHDKWSKTIVIEDEGWLER